MQVGAGVSETVPDSEEATARLDLFRYLTADLAGEYRAIMSLFGSTLLADLSAAEVSDGLAQRGVVLSVEEVTTRCEQLERWGNLVRGIRDARVATVQDYVRSRARYQASKLGVRVHREAEAIVAAGDGAREVARELLGATAETLDRIVARMAAATDARPVDAEALSGDVTTVFNNQRLFSDSVRDFYAYVNTVLTRYDLAGEEYQQFKRLLLDYIDLLTADVARHAPVVARRFAALEPVLDDVLAALAGLPTLQSADARTERLPGRTREDWEHVRGWYTGADGRSGPETLRMAADQALGQLLANTKRMLASAGTGVSRRADLLKLAAWFDGADADQAHRLYAAAFGAYPARHLLGGPEEPDPRDGATTSWWAATPVEVPLSLRERGDRGARGRTSSVPDPGLDRVRLLAEAQGVADARAAAVRELVAAGRLDGAEVSPAALSLLLGQLTRLLAVHPQLEAAARATDTDLGLTLEAVPDPAATTTLRTPDGDLTVHGLVLEVAAAGTPAAAAPSSPAAASSATATIGADAEAHAPTHPEPAEVLA
ncbi:TIGR02677 family protein [Georgenia thermotolerans]|uniref:TIGR02677 family protein n=1 Tax=Georgenia thermotolerans TaxID=527326 RepID=A0A7J5UJA9_9MICO|nr:TIGR02677 family protein [Georgenia thermotolerans]